jgi:hypothetical protein
VVWCGVDVNISNKWFRSIHFCVCVGVFVSLVLLPQSESINDATNSPTPATVLCKTVATNEEEETMAGVTQSDMRRRQGLRQSVSIALHIYDAWCAVVQQHPAFLELSCSCRSVALGLKTVSVFMLF